MIKKRLSPGYYHFGLTAVLYGFNALTIKLL
jgi:hypothetical protein